MTITMFQCDQYIRQLEEGTLPCQAGCSEGETLEANILHELSTIRDKAGKSSLTALHKSNDGSLWLHGVFYQHVSDDCLCGAAGHLWQEGPQRVR